MITPALIVGYLEGQPGRRATFKHLLRDMNARGQDRQRLKEALAGLVREGRLAERKGGFELQRRTAAAAAPAAPRPAAGAAARAGAKAGTLRGKLSLHRDGYGFVAPEGGGDDVFIPPPATGGAMHGDTVAVQVKPGQAPGRREGRVVEVLGRAHATLIGEVRKDSRGYWLRPLDDRIQAVVRLADAPAGAEGQIAEVEMAQFPTASAPGQGRVLELLGRRDDFGVDVEIIIRKHHLPHRFPPDVEHQAAALPQALPEAELARRRDFRGLPIVTIDGETARDFDDAVLVRRLDDGTWELQVHIADVAYYVRPGSPIDREARLRGTSVYFPDRAVPMLPHELSSGLCSLRPDEDRLVMSCLMRIDGRGEVLSHELCEGVIRSKARMTYTKVNAILEGDAALRAEYAPLAEGFERMAELQKILYAKRQRRGSIDFDLPEPEIAFDEFGLMRSIVKSERNIAHRLIEEFMLAAAETVARHIRDLGRDSVYRIHEQPDVKKVLQFEEIAARFGYSLGAGPLPVQAMRVRTAGGRDHRGRTARGARPVEVAQEAKFKISPRHYQKLAAKAAGTPEERILSFLMLRSLKQARYSAKNVGHFALATDCYTHFTSPIRRYPDLTVHRILKAVWASAQTPSAEQLEPLCASCSEAERRADEAERELMEWKKVRFMESRVGDEFDALILHATREGFFVELVDQFIEGFVPASALDDDDYRFRSLTQEWVGEASGRRFRLGGRLPVRVERIDPVRMQIHFAPALEPPKPARAAGRVAHRGKRPPARPRRGR